MELVSRYEIVRIFLIVLSRVKDAISVHSYLLSVLKTTVPRWPQHSHEWLQ